MVSKAPRKPKVLQRRLLTNDVKNRILVGRKNGWLATLLWARRIPTPTKHPLVAHIAQSLANIPHTICLWKPGQIQLRVDESGGHTIRRRVVVPFTHMHLTDIAGDVSSSCEVRS